MPGLLSRLFFGQRWSGEPQESQEMAPEWLGIASLPLDQMWDDEAYWLPRVLAGETLAGTITYDEACKLVTRALLTVRAGKRRHACLPGSQDGKGCAQARGRGHR